MARSWVLGGTTLKNPQGYTPTEIEISSVITTAIGATRKQIRGKKLQHQIDWTLLTQTEVSDILSLYNQNTALDFTVTDGQLSIPTVSVQMDIMRRAHNAKGSEFREDISILLTEVNPR